MEPEDRDASRTLSPSGGNRRSLMHAIGRGSRACDVVTHDAPRRHRADQDLGNFVVDRRTPVGSMPRSWISAPREIAIRT